MVTHVYLYVIINIFSAQRKKLAYRPFRVEVNLHIDLGSTYIKTQECLVIKCKKFLKVYMVI